MNPTTPKDKRVILVIEDEKPLLEAIKTKLIKNNFEVLSCVDVETGLKLVADAPRIDLIWLDFYLMGKETGLDFIVKMKKKFPAKAIPIFIVSVSIDSEKSNGYLHLGVERFYTKSNFGLQEIIDDVSNYLNK